MEEKVKNSAGQVDGAQAFKSVMDQLDYLQKENYAMKQQLQNTITVQAIKRMEFLFKVIENKDIFDEHFVKECIEEITISLTIPEQPDTPESEKPLKD